MLGIVQNVKTLFSPKNKWNFIKFPKFWFFASKDLKEKIISLKKSARNNDPIQFG